MKRKQMAAAREWLKAMKYDLFFVLNGEANTPAAFQLHQFLIECIECWLKENKLIACANSINFINEIELNVAAASIVFATQLCLL